MSLQLHENAHALGGTRRAAHYDACRALKGNEVLRFRVKGDVRHGPLFAKPEKRRAVLVDSTVHGWNYTAREWNAVEEREAVKRECGLPKAAPIT